MKQMNKVKDLTGKRFGRLTVIGIDDRNTKRTYWNCMCDCGNVKSVRSDILQRGTTMSCGCYKKEVDRINLTANHKHKMSGTRIYGIWTGMKQRCYNEHDARYCRYGGRGIKVCEEWKADFSAFYEWALANGYGENLTIDRIDNDGDYCPENCRWSTNVEQCNNRSTNITIKIGNATKTLTQWCEIFELDFKTIDARYRRNGYAGIDELFNS